jgi:CRISPR/Cas system-associated exonuclease Cas4 (RecB family)
MPVAASPSLATTARLCAAALDRALREATLEPELNRPRSLRTAFWPSDLMLCRRKTGLGFLEVERDQPDPRVVESRTWGSLFHSEYYRRLSALENRGFRVVATEQPVLIRIPGVELPIRGRYDAMVEARGDAIAALTEGLLPGELKPNETIRFLVDIKAVSSYAAREAAASGRPSPQDEAEMTCYLHHTGLPFGIVIYHDKQTSIREPIPVPYSESRFQEVQDWIRSVYEHIRAGRVPPRDHDPERSDFPCGYCQFRTACLTIGPGDGTQPPPPEQLPLETLTDDGQLRLRGQELLDRIIAIEAEAKAMAETAAPLRGELESIVRRVGRIDTEHGSAQITTTTEWDTEALRVRIAELGLLEEVLEISTSKVRRLIDSGRLPSSLLSQARRTSEGSLRITAARRERNGDRSG